VTLKNIWLSGDYRHSGAVETRLWVSLALLTLGYVLARFLKKKGLLKDALESVS
jgi:hypothetical protein